MVRDLTEVEEIKKRWQEYTEVLYQKDLNVPDHPDSVVADLDSMANNKASGGDSIPVELFKILKDDAVKVLHSICQQV